MTGVRHIILFDGECNLCNNTVQFIIKKDQRAIFKFASLQSEAGKELLSNFGLSSKHFKSFVYIKGEEYYLKSDAALQVAATLGGVWKAAKFFYIIPPPIRNRVYDFIAANRYKWFGKRGECIIPTPELKQRFLT